MFRAASCSSICRASSTIPFAACRRRNPMHTMAPPQPARSTGSHVCRLRLSTGAAAAAEARRQLRAALRGWDVHVDHDVAVLLTSDLVTNAVRHEAGETV